MILLQAAEVFDPRPVGRRDVLIGAGRVLRIAERIDPALADTVIDVQGQLLLPGLVDALTHPCGGGGEGGFGNRTPEMEASAFVAAGVTCPVGALGTDSIGRSLDVLYGSTMALRAAGLNAWMYSGAYRVPAPTLTGDVARDLYLVEPVIGVGEVAVADHRGTQPSAAELRRLAAETQLGGILSGVGGTVLVHVGAGASRLALLRAAIEDSDLAPACLYPTHVNRSRALLDEAAAWTLGGGFVDITVSTTEKLIDAGDVPAADALRHLIAAGASPEQITLSSDAGGSLPVYVDGELKGLTAASPYCLPALLAELLREDALLFELALAGMTRNPARALRLPEGTGCIGEGLRADLLLFDPAVGQIARVFAGGRELTAEPPEHGHNSSSSF
ncbi:MAG: amidohydrolase family protein [Halieaceae bacterium]|jgi:beta-aspartyl-dipeptidase (metallo-type)|nr:amidohydrolase family protein [Halieaceae bacterium]